jgi:hypothetical protein
MNLKDFMTNQDSEMVLVKGIGQVRLTQAKKRVQEMLQDLSGRVDNLVWEPGHDQSGWQTVDSLVKRGVLQAYLDAIVEATKRQH